MFLFLILEIIITKQINSYKPLELSDVHDELSEMLDIHQNE